MSEKADEIVTLIEQSACALSGLREQAAVLLEITDAAVHALQGGGTVFLCGNGGSASQCQHVAAEFTGRFQLERRGFRAIALTADSAALTAIGNDYGFEQVFARQLEALARPGDLLIGLSTSGRSKNVIRAFERAGELSVTTIALTGPHRAELADVADLCLLAPGSTTATVQECHLAALHVVCGLVERHFAS